MIDEPVLDSENGKALKGYTLKTMSVQLRIHVNDLSVYVTKQLHPSETKRVVWEVYCGVSRMSKAVEHERTVILIRDWLGFQSFGTPTTVLGSI